MAGNKIKKITQLLVGLKECWPDFDMAPNEFINPTLNSVLKFYERFLHAFGIKSDTIMTLLYQNYPQFQDKEFEEIIYVYIVYSCANRLYQKLELTTVGSFALSLTNFINPTDDKSLIPRTSLLANFLYYVKMTTEVSLLPETEKVLEELNSLVDLTKEESIKKEESNNAYCTLSSNFNKIEKLKSNNSKLKNRLNIAQAESEELDSKIQKLNAELKLYKEENVTLSENIENNMQEKGRLESLVVDDYETILAEQNKLEKEIVDQEESLSDLMKNIELKTEVESNLIKTFEIINKFIESLDLPQLLYMYNVLEEHKNENEKIVKETHAFQRAENEAHNLKKQLIQEIKELEEKLLALNLKSNIHTQTLETELSQLDKEYKGMNNQFEKSLEEVAELNESLKHVTNCCDQFTQEIEKQHKFYETMYASFLDVKSSLDNKAVNVKALMKEKVKLVTFEKNPDK